MAYQFKIQIQGITKPPVWRKVVIPENFTFLRLHNVIQAAFGWGDYHLFEFTDKEFQSNIRISNPSEEDSEYNVMTLDASKVKLSRVFTGDIRKLLYIYDFGDHWVHTITLEATSEDKQKKAVCIAGKGNCPPEDCGGVYGYEAIKNIFQTKPESEEAIMYREWLGLEEGGVWNVNAFDIENTNAWLKHI